MYGDVLQHLRPLSLSLSLCLYYISVLFSSFLAADFVNSATLSDSRLTVRITAALLIGALSVTLLAPDTFLPRRCLNRLVSYMARSRKLFFGGRYGKHNQSREAQFARKNGGEVGGLSNEGNTCFMNSVIQSLASSHSLLDFIENSMYETVEVPDGCIVKTNKIKRTMGFTAALKSLLDDLNGAYGLRGKEFSTRLLMKKMSDGPKQNFFMGYNQEDAQEFYQLVMRKVEKEFNETRSGSSDPLPESEEKKDAPEYVSIDSVSGYITGCDQIGYLGKVYVPAHQANPNIADSARQLFGMGLVTPVDGIAAERIGCVSCGETGGIRYSVISGMSLNLPYEQGFSPRYDLIELLRQWETPEIIDEVNCNRCGLMQTKQFLLQNSDSASSEKMVSNFEERLADIEAELQKDTISNDAFERLTIKQMTHKTLKQKQILLSRPPPLLCIHINRSVIDPRTFMIVKNPKSLSFPSELDLNAFVAVPDQINLDARLPFKKHSDEEPVDTEESPNMQAELDSLEDTVPEADVAGVSVAIGLFEIRDGVEGSEGDENGSEGVKDPAENESEDVNDVTEQSSENANEGAEKGFESANSIGLYKPALNKDLLYRLKAVITHMGTHHYGHYICYRKWRGTWWKVNDELVSATSEDEVLCAPGTFMLFFEHRNADKLAQPESFEDQSSEEAEADDERLLFTEISTNSDDEMFRGLSDSPEKLFSGARYDFEEERAFV